LPIDRATSATNLPSAKPAQCTLDVDVEPVLTLTGGVAKLHKLAHVCHLVVGNEAATALPHNCAFTRQ
jgi:hypothetical protein